MESKEALLKKADKIQKEFLAWIEARFKLMQEEIELREKEVLLAAKTKKRKKSN